MPPGKELLSNIKDDLSSNNPLDPSAGESEKEKKSQKRQSRLLPKEETRG